MKNITMAESNVRKSGRPRKRTSYLDDDIGYEYMMDTGTDFPAKNGLNSENKRRRLKDASPKQRKISPSIASPMEPTSMPPTDDESNHTVDYYPNGEEDYPGSELSPHSTSETSPKSSKSKKTVLVQPRSGGFTCEICEKVCVDLASYKRHMKGHSSDRKFQCEICSKAFIDTCSLKRHMKIHDDERPFTCDLCFKSFRDIPSLNRHQQTHTDRPRSFTCQTCGKAFTDKHGLTRHERTHTGLRPFECGICGKTFSESGSFKRHEKIHIGIRKYSCIVCGKKFLEKQSLLRHQRVVCGVTEDTTKSDNQSQSSLDNLDSSSMGDSMETREPDLQTSSSGNSSLVSNKPPKKHRDTQGVEAAGDVCEEPSLQSLMKKDPNLYAGISDLVESIDSYEQMLDLCGDNGHSQIEAALTRDPEPMPDNLLCFECGEHLVDGENFHKAGKTFRLPLKNQFKCLNCEEDDNGDPGQRPNLSGDVHSSESPGLSNNTRETEVQRCNLAENGSSMEADANEAETTLDKDNQSEGRAEPDSLPVSFASGGNTIPGTVESLEHFRERLRAQHGVNFLGEMYPHLVTSVGAGQDDTDSTTATSTNASVSRSSSTDDVEPYSQDLEPTVTFQESSGLAMNTKVTQSKTKPYAKGTAMPEDGSMSMESEVASPSTPSLPQPVYVTDQTSIPTVFPCHLCTKVFATPAFLARHLYLHKNSPHKCMICSKTFTNAMSLRRHITTHTGEKPYGCPKCYKRFRDPSNFSKHKKICTAIPSTDPPALTESPLTPATPVPQSKRGRKPKKTLVGEVATDQSIQPEMRFSYDVDVSSDTALSSAGVGSSCTTAAASYGTIGSDTVDPAPASTAGYPESDGNSNMDDEDVDLTVSFGEPPQQFDSQTPDHTKSQEDNEDSFLMSEAQGFGEFNNFSAVSEPDGTELAMAVHCGVCERSFMKQKDLERHMRFHSAENPDLTCEECGKSFTDMSGLKRHARIHADTRPHVCEFCHRGYCDNWSLRKHQSRGCLFSELQVPASFMVPCPQCNRMFATVEVQLEHIATIHKGALKFECDICLKRFSEAFNLKRHRRLHLAICTGCEREFKDVKLLAEHQRTECPATGLSNGTSVAVKEDNFPCPECGRVYSTKANLERHKKFHWSLKPFGCEFCSKRFSEAFKLKRHMKVHSELRPHVCTNCNKGFSNAQGLRQHLHKTRCLKNTYKLPKPEVTTPDQSERAPRAPVKTPTPIVSPPPTSSSGFPCELCGKVFLKKFLLVRHMNVHSAEKPYICGQCGKAYKDTSSLKRHCLVHRGVKGFVCPDCGKAFFYSDSLRRHRNGLCGRMTQVDGQLASANTSSGRKRGRKKKQQQQGTDVLNNNNNNNNTIDMDTNKPNVVVESTSDIPVHEDSAGHEPDKDVTQTPGGDMESNSLVEPASQHQHQEQDTTTARSHHLPRCPLRLPPRENVTSIGPWSCIKGGYCWRCSVYFPSNSALAEHFVIHRHKRPYFSRHSFHRWSRKFYLTSDLRRHQGEVRVYAASRPEETSPGLKIKFKLLPKPVSEDMSSPESAGNPLDLETEDLEDLNSRPRRSIARAKWSWISQIQ